jgi:hypothetical protein
VQNVHAVMRQPPIFQIMNLEKILAIYLGKYCSTVWMKVKYLLSGLVRLWTLLIVSYANEHI